MARDKPGKRRPVQESATTRGVSTEIEHRVSTSQGQQQHSLGQASGFAQDAQSAHQLSSPSQLEAQAQPQPSKEIHSSEIKVRYGQPCNVPSEIQLKKKRSKNAEKFDFPLYFYDIDKWQVENGIKESLKPGQTLDDIPGSTRKNPIRLQDVNDIMSLPNGVWIQHAFTDEEGKVIEYADKPFPLFLPPCSYAIRVPDTDQWVWKKRTADDLPSTWTWEEYREYLDLWEMPTALFCAHRNGRTDHPKERNRDVLYPEPDPRGPYKLHPSQWDLLEDELASLDPSKHSIVVRNYPYQVRSRPKPVELSACRIVEEEGWRWWPWRSVTNKSVARSSQEAIDDDQVQDLAIEPCLSGSYTQFQYPNEPRYHTRLEIADKNNEYTDRIACDPTVLVNPSRDFNFRGSEGRFEFIHPMDAWFAQVKFTDWGESRITAEQLFLLMQQDDEVVRVVQANNIRMVWIPKGVLIDATHHINIDLSHELQQEEIMKYPASPSDMNTEPNLPRQIINFQRDQRSKFGTLDVNGTANEDTIMGEPTDPNDEDTKMEATGDDDYTTPDRRSAKAEASSARDGELDRSCVIVGVEEPQKFQVCDIYFPQMDGFDWHDKDDVAKLNRWRQQTYRRKIGPKLPAKRHFAKAELHYLDRFYQHFGNKFYAKDLADSFNKHLNEGIAKRSLYSIEERFKRLVRDNLGRDNRSNIRVNPLDTEESLKAYGKKLRAWETEWKSTVQKECIKANRTEDKTGPGRKYARETGNRKVQSSNSEKSTPTVKKLKSATSTEGDTERASNEISITKYKQTATRATVEWNSKGVPIFILPHPLPSDFYAPDGVTVKWKYFKSPRDAQGNVIPTPKSTTETPTKVDTTDEGVAAENEDNGADVQDDESSYEGDAIDNKDDFYDGGSDVGSDETHQSFDGEPEIDDSSDP